MADGQIVFEITADGKKAVASVKDVTRAIETEAGKWDKAADNAAGEAAGSWKAAVGKIAGALSAAGIASMIAKWGKAAIEAASDLAEVQNVVDVTFGEGASKIESWSKQAGKAFGLTETQAKKYTSTLGAMMKSSGIADDKIVEMSTDLAGLAADMASFYNLDHDTAFQKIRAGISGETEPLKQLGINMSVANLEAFALEKGITKSFNAMSQGEQVALRYQYIMQATADAQGDFSRTADGYANAQRRVATAMETIKTEGGKLLIQVVEPLTTGIAGLLEKLTAMPETTVLDDIAAIDSKTGEKVSKIRQTAEDAVLLADELSDLGKNSRQTADAQALWLETCNRLVKTIPGLSSIINTETGEVKGGTQAVYDYVKAWEEGRTKLAMIKALEQKENAISQRFSDLPGLQLDMAVEQRRARQRMEELKAVYKKYGIEIETDSNGRISRNTDLSGIANLSKAAQSEIQSAADAYANQQKIADDATAAYQKQADALEEAVAALDEYRQTVNEMPGDIDNATTATGELTEQQQEMAKAAVNASKEMLQALADYVEGVRQSTAQAVDSVVKGFNVLSRPTTELEEKRSKLIQQQMELNRTTKDGKKRYEELQKQIDELNKSIEAYSTKGMSEGLQSQLAFMDEYLANLEKAKSMGLSGDLLASLSDGSVQSAEYLSQLVANPEQAAAVDQLFQQVQEKKKEFTDALTEQKLSVDDTYNAMVEKAKTAVSGMNLGEEAKTSMASTVSGLASGISEKLPEVKTAVDSILEQINRLSGFGINVTIGDFGTFLDGEHETGLDYVPFDGYLAGLHEGEGILTAEENRIWQRFKNGSSPQTMDYDALGATMRDNVKAGGNVYLNGREVGRVISAQQGSDYRAMQRSGFQI